MALSFAHGAIQWLTTDALNADLTVSGLGFQPKAIRFYWTGIQNTGDAVSEASVGHRGVGFADGTNQRAVASHAADGVGSMTTSAIVIDNGVVSLLNSAPAVVGRLSLQSIESDGFILNVDDVTPHNVTIFYEAWGGDDITNVTVGTITSAGTGDPQTNTATGFTSTDDDTQVVMFANNFAVTINTAGEADSAFATAFATGTGAEQIVVAGLQDDGSASGDSWSYCQTGKCIAVINAGGGATLDSQAALTAFGTNTFSLTWDTIPATAYLGAYMAIKGGQWKAGSLTIAGQTLNATQTVSGLSFQPIGLSLIGRMGVASTADTPDQNPGGDMIGIGSGSSTTSRRSQGYLDEDGTGFAELDHVIQYDQVLAYPSTAGGLLTAYDISQMNSGGFQLINDLAGGVADEWIGYLTFGSAAGGNVSVTPTTKALTISTFAPVIKLGVTPSTASLSLTTFAPSVVLGIKVVPSTLGLSLSTFAPTVTATEHQFVTPTTKALSLATFAPTVTVQSPGVTVTPDTANLTLATFAPTVALSDNKIVTPGIATLSLSTFVPTVALSDNKTVIPAVATLLTNSFAPTVVVSDHKTVVPNVLNLVLTTFAPTVTGDSSPPILTRSSGMLAAQHVRRTMRRNR